MTNGDNIRSMTDEELADFLISRESDPCPHCEYGYKPFGCRLGSPCVYQAFEVLKKWLSERSEKEEEGC